MNVDVVRYKCELRLIISARMKTKKGELEEEGGAVGGKGKEI